MKPAECLGRVRQFLTAATGTRAGVLAPAVAAAAAAAARGGDPLVPLSDEFDAAATLSLWSRVHDVEGWKADHLQLLEIDASAPGHLVMVPWSNSWYADYRSDLTFKSVTGDVAFTVDVAVTAAAGGGIPGTAYSLAGAMIRTPRDITDPSEWTPGGENYVFLSCGYAHEFAPCAPGAGPHLELKTTVDGQSTLCASPIGAATCRIQIARVGTAVICLMSVEGAAWEVIGRFERSDMPSTLQVGMVAYTDWPKVETYTPFFHNGNVLNDALDPDPSSNPFVPFAPDLRAEYDYARFATPLVPPELAGVDLVTEATDEELLSFLGDHAIPTPLVGDLDGDGDVDGADLATVLGSWGTRRADLDGDGTTDGGDLALLLGGWTG